MISIVVPAYNQEKTIDECLAELQLQAIPRELYEIIVVDDGSTDATREIAQTRGVCVLTQSNQGAAAARNLGAARANGDIVLFIDGDCIPEKDWMYRMLAPFADPEIMGAGGMKRTRQRGIIARFIQMEFDYRYDNERALRNIDFIDSGTAAYRRVVFVDNGGFDTRLHDAEDVDLSYRLSSQGRRMAFADGAIVYHSHPESLIEYLRRKFVYAYWRTQVYARHPGKVASDSRTPQTQRIQGALAGLSIMCLALTVVWFEALWGAAFCVVALLLTTLPLVGRYWKRDAAAALIAPVFIGLAAFAGGAGVACGILRRRAI